MRRTLTLLPLLLLALGAGAAPLLHNPQLVAAGDGGWNLAADVNGDGHTDMVVASSTRSLTAILDNGTGPFAAPVVTPITTTITSCAAGDVNGDGRSDVVAFDSTTHSIVVFFGNVDGTFTHGPITPTSIASARIAVGDFNGDHQMDVVLGTIDMVSKSNIVATYLGDGSGNFGNPAATAVGDAVSWIAPVDLNADGRTDIVVVTLVATTTYLSKGDATFAFASRFPSTNVAWGDFNHDGKIDLALAVDFNVDIYLGNGDGTATKSTTYVVGALYATTTDAVKVGDLDGDGNLDLVVASSGGTISVLRGTGDGTFQQPTRTFLGDYGTPQIFLSDFDRDGKLDLILTGTNQSRAPFSFARGNGNGTFALHSAAVTFNSYGAPHNATAVTADVNHDGKTDVVVLESNPDNPSSGHRLSVLLNDGTGHLSSPIVTPNVGAFSYDRGPSLAMADINGDGIVDAVLLSDPLGVPVARSLLGNGDGTFGTPIPFTIPAMGDGHLADFDGDNVPDLLISAGSRYILQHGNGNGTFAAGVITDIGDFLAAPLLLADLNGDGKMDFVGVHYGFQLSTYTSIFINDGKGNFTESSVGGIALAVRDFNNDGKPDVVSRGSSGLEVRLGRGDGTFGSPIGTFLYFGGESIRPAVAADFNGDGYMDFALDTTIYLGRGDGTFSSASTLRAYSIANLMTADMDGNGSPDLLFFTSGSQIGIVLTNIGSDPTTPSSITLTSDGPTTLHANATLTATVTGGVTPLSGVVVFAADETTFAIIPVGADGKASATFTAPFGTSTVRATYTGDEYYRSSTTSLSLSASKVATSVNLSSDTNPQAYGSPINLYAFVVVPTTPPVIAPTGLIILHEGSYVLGTIRANGAALKISGGTLSVGSHVITADYVGDTTYKPSTTTLMQVVTEPTVRKRAARH